jgi:Amylo-alpha-1,6-glucosidase
MNRCDGKGNCQLLDDLNRRLPVGAEVARGGEATSFRVWAPLCQEANVEDWDVTPIWGKAIEINALKLPERWVTGEQENKSTGFVADHSAWSYASFNDRLWYLGGAYLYDVVDGRDGDDPLSRPDQVLSISLSRPVLEASRWDSVINVVSQ